MSKQEVKCKKCSKKFFKKTSEIKRSKNNFCSNSCANSYNNKYSDRKHGPNRRVFKYCKECGILIDNRNTYCNEHKPVRNIDGQIIDPKNTGIKPLALRTIEQVESLCSKHANRYGSIRDNARLVAKKLGLLKKCKICGYNKHVETCHIKDISKFNKNILISEVNSPENLVGLCKNHHWELDHNQLSNDDIRVLIG